jgi:4-amino-4-deoxy-L-arabinose transferase-like glycosyltransferase
VNARRDPWWIAGATLLAHLAVANRYDFFRDELYFIVCGRHPAFGYVDQPPLVPLLAAASQLFGEHLVLLRSIPAVAHAATVLVTCALARVAGARRFGTALAGIAAAIAPIYLGMMTTLGTSSFEPLAWTAVTYFVGRAVVLDDARAWLWTGLVAGVDLEIKYELPLYLLPLLLGILLAGQARRLARRELALGLGVAFAIALPSAIWQLTHGLPFLELMHNQAGGKNVALAPGAFVVNQVLSMNPLLAPLWLAGMIAPFVDARLRPWRFASLAFAMTFALMLVMHAKDYYLSPAYAPMFALGAVTLERVRARTLRAGYLTAAVGVSALAAPVAMPILDPPELARYLHALHLGPPAAERLRQSEIPQTFADMLGWRSYVRTVTQIYRALTPDEQRRVAIVADNYGEAAAVDFFGAAEGLPPAISMHNQYFLWGTHGRDGSVVMRINEEPEHLASKCQSVTLAGRFGAPYVMPYENDAPITICRGLKWPLDELWPKLKFYY